MKNSRYILKRYDSSEKFIKEYPVWSIAQGVEIGYKNGWHFSIIEGEGRSPKLYWTGNPGDLAWHNISILDAIKLACEKDNKDACNP